MSVLQEALGGAAVVVEVPRAGVPDWIAVAEVLLQEGLGAWAVPLEASDLASETLAIHGRRARVGVCGVTDAAGVRAAVELGAHFVLAPVWHPSLVEAAGGVPFIGGALTPTEVAGVLATGAGAVAITPADALGTSYARTLPPLFPDADLVPWGRLERYQVEHWRQAGAAAAVVSEVILRTGPEPDLNDVDEVARRAAAFRPLLGD
ncbi:MAG: hypothetical protein Q4F65_14200 [Propionibacteriaceae bacterium]|nr:hypothetical protein [Propionibacteriaceae bacterium]